MKKYPLLFGLFTLALASCASETQDASQSFSYERNALGTAAGYVDVRNFTYLGGDVVGSGQPSPEVIQDLSGRGYSTVINLRTAGEGLANEADLVAEQGLHYVQIPIRGSSLGIEDAQALQMALANAPSGGVLIHCGSGSRVGAVWGLKMGLEHGLTPDEAVAAGRRAGMRGDTLAQRVHDEISAAAHP